MLLKIRKSSAIYFITNDTPKGQLINLSSHLYLNLHQITELSHYTLKTSLDKQSLDGKKLTLTPETKVASDSGAHFCLLRGQQGQEAPHP